MVGREGGLSTNQFALGETAYCALADAQMGKGQEDEHKDAHCKNVFVVDLMLESWTRLPPSWWVRLSLK